MAQAGAAPGSARRGGHPHPGVRSRGRFPRLRAPGARTLRPGGEIPRGQPRVTGGQHGGRRQAGGDDGGARRGPRQARAAGGAGRGAPLPVLREGRSRHQRRGVRPAPEVPGGPGGAVPGAAQPRLAHPEGGRVVPDGVHRGRTPPAHALPRQHLQRRGTGRLDRPHRP
ncbi:putative Coenzyme F420-0:L-glutamate ligase @ F420-1:L-glutamate ligase [Streptomyces misionensis JCM 4497]